VWLPRRDFVGGNYVLVQRAKRNILRGMGLRNLKMRIKSGRPQNQELCGGKGEGRGKGANWDSVEAAVGKKKKQRPCYIDT